MFLAKQSLIIFAGVPQNDPHMAFSCGFAVNMICNDGIYSGRVTILDKATLCCLTVNIAAFAGDAGCQRRASARRRGKLFCAG